MHYLVCPECGTNNTLEAERCQECEHALGDVAPTEFADSQQTGLEKLELLSQADDDLPGLLHALKQEDDDNSVEGDISDETPENFNVQENTLDSDEIWEEDEIPDWLQRIRNRASKEEDSIGEITQKLFAAKESLEEEKSGTQHKNYESWIKNIQDPAKDDTAGQPPEDEVLPEDDTDESDLDADWLTKIRKAQGKSVEGEPQEQAIANDKGGDSLLQWLVALEEGGEEPSQIPYESSEDEPFLDETTHQSRVSAEDIDEESTQKMRVSDEIYFRHKTPVLSVSREEQSQADQLAATIVDERMSRPIRERRTGSSAWVIRLVIAAVLIIGLSLSLLISANSELPDSLLKPHNASISSWARNLPADSALLIIFDYQAGFANELSLVATPILETVLTPESEVSILSSTASGVLLSRQLLSEIEAELTIVDLGYYPVSAYGVFGAAIRSSSSYRFIDKPEFDKALPTDGFDNILILSDNYEGTRTWVEQLSALLPDTTINLLVTAQTGPLMMPYWESGQVTGMVSGLPEAALVESELVGGRESAMRWQAYQTGTLMLLVLLLIGAIFSDDRIITEDERGGL